MGNLIAIAWLVGTWYLTFIVEYTGHDPVKERKKDLISRSVVWFFIGWVPVLGAIGVLPLSW